MKYNCIIVDDNIIERDAVRMHLEKIQSLNIVADCESAQQAIELVNSEPVDIIFSDVQMPDMDGFELNKSLRSAPVFIYITSFSEYAAESFDVDAIDFVVKPANFSRLVRATNKAIEYIELKRNFNNTAVKKATASIINKSADAREYFFIKETNGFTKLQYADVLYVESMGDFSKIYTCQGMSHVILVSLKNFESQLPEEIFRRVHKQYIINLLQISTITTTEIILNNKQVVPVSTVYRQHLMDTVVQKKLLHRS